MSETNHSLSQILGHIASYYRYLGTAERFRALAYEKAARVIDGLPDDISVFIASNTVEDIPGIGESLAEKIQEYVSTGRIKKYEELKRKVPVELLELLSVSGFGPQTLKQIHEELKIKTKAALIKALEEGRVSQLKGFGPKKVENMMRGLKLQKQSEERMLLWEAQRIGERIISRLAVLKEVHQVELAGSVRRGKETIGDIDILVSCAPTDRRKIIQVFTTMPECKLVLAKGETKASILIKERNKQVDLRVIQEKEWGAALLYLTGSKEHNVYLRGLAKEQGLKISEYGVFDAKTNKWLAGKSEEEIYRLFGFQFIPPELREMRGEFDIAARKKLPRLIEVNDIKGDMQMHSTWSDGTMDIELLARYVLDHFHYEYIVLTDHSQSSRIAGGKSEKDFLRQMKEIDKLNAKLGTSFIKKGVEVDILPDGRLDFTDSFLEKLDWVCASIHSGFKKDNTQRLISACRNRFVNAIGHPSGRLIGKREPYPVDWPLVFNVAAETGTAFEINAQPDRLDLNDELAHQASQAGVMLTISTDSHAAENFSFLPLGVTVARRAFCTPSQILNTKPWKEVVAFVTRKRKTPQT